MNLVDRNAMAYGGFSFAGCDIYTELPAAKGKFTGYVSG